MPEHTPSTLNHFALFSFQDVYFDLNRSDRQAIHKDFTGGLRSMSPSLSIYQLYPAHSEMDFLVWSAQEVRDEHSPGSFFTQFARCTNEHRRWIVPKQAFWGFTKPSQYTKTRSTQEIDPFSKERKAYLIVYPFVKTAEWYLMGREARQGMMNEHIRVGKQYQEISQLLLYSFGLQDQEFIVVYETDNLAQFSDLVYELRNTEARRFTFRDTPNFTGVYHPAEETLALWE